ncbi:MAG: 30S ribosomal protein S6 [Candidatus Moraniibacteriota bacterium]|nr:MAG: 30S ribosomal protein S6 [Candidatus Moranbacteria bacterium]
MEYELMFLIAEEKKPEFSRIKDEVRAAVEAAGGTWKSEELEFDRKLAYEIKHNWRGTYYVSRFTLPEKDERDESKETKDAIAEITRQMNLNQNVLRYIIVNAEELPPLSEFAKQFDKTQKEDKKQLKETGEKIDEKLEEALNI